MTEPSILIEIDPADAPGVCDHMRRSEAEVARWRRRPYVVTVAGGYEVRCLDGLRSDRPTTWATVRTLAEAMEAVDSD